MDAPGTRPQKFVFSGWIPTSAWANLKPRLNKTQTSAKSNTNKWIWGEHHSRYKMKKCIIRDTDACVVYTRCSILSIVDIYIYMDGWICTNYIRYRPLCTLSRARKMRRIKNVYPNGQNGRTQQKNQRQKTKGKCIVCPSLLYYMLICHLLSFICCYF